MKANQKLKHSEEAVSPVIGVILMVAVTVVLAAAVFVIVSQITPNTDTAPDIGVTRDGTTLLIVRVSSTVPWSDLTVTGCTTIPTTGNVAAGDTLEGCTNPTRIAHAPTNTLVFSG